MKTISVWMMCLGIASAACGPPNEPDVPEEEPTVEPPTTPQTTAPAAPAAAAPLPK